MPAGCIGPFDQHRQQQNEDGAVIHRQQSVVDPLARRQFPAHILFNEIHQRDEDFHDQHRDNDHCPKAADFRPAEHQEQQGVEHIADAVELKLMTLRRPPRQPLGHLMMVEGVERSHRDLDGDQGPQQDESWAGLPEDGGLANQHAKAGMNDHRA